MDTQASTASAPSPWATHADLSALRREIQLDVRHELSLIRDAIAEMSTQTATSKQWAFNVFLSVTNLVCAGVYVAWSIITQ